MVAGDREVVGEDILLPGITVLDPVPACVLVHSAVVHSHIQILVVLAGELACLATGAFA
jgi:hypothetical protein